MSLSMVIVAGLVGLGRTRPDAVKGLTKSQYELGTGLAAGICIVLLAAVLDRITQAWAGLAGPPVAVQLTRGAPTCEVTLGGCTSVRGGRAR